MTALDVPIEESKMTNQAFEDQIHPVMEWIHMSRKLESTGNVLRRKSINQRQYTTAKKKNNENNQIRRIQAK